jgi:hypothetical protein
VEEEMGVPVVAVVAVDVEEDEENEEEEDEEEEGTTARGEYVGEIVICSKFNTLRPPSMYTKWSFVFETEAVLFGMYRSFNNRQSHFRNGFHVAGLLLLFWISGFVAPPITDDEDDGSAAAAAAVAVEGMVVEVKT